MTHIGRERLEPERSAILRGLPKVELHRHLEGSLRLSTLLELGRLRGLDLPLDDLAALAPHVTWNEGEPRSLAHFLTKFRADWYKSYQDVERIAAEVVEDAVLEGIVHLELRFSPEHLSRKSGLSPLGCIEAVVEAAQDQAQEAGMGLGFLITFTRERYDFGLWKQLIDRAAELSDRGVVGIDLAGDEHHHPNADFERIIARAKDTRILAVSIHAGEGTSANQVRTAVEVLQADRIGHGLSAVEDASVVELLRHRRVALEMCLTSNYQTGCVDDLTKHPLPVLDKARVKVTLNADDPSIHQSTLIDDYDLAVTRLGYNLDDLQRLELNAVEAAFLGEPEREKLRVRVVQGYEQSQGQGLL